MPGSIQAVMHSDGRGDIRKVLRVILGQDLLLHNPKTRDFISKEAEAGEDQVSWPSCKL